MKTVKLHEAKTHLSRLVEEAVGGEEIIIAKGSKPLVRLVALGERRVRRLGTLKGKVHVSRDFDSQLPDDVLDSFEG